MRGPAGGYAPPSTHRFLSLQSITRRVLLADGAGVCLRRGGNGLGVRIIVESTPSWTVVAAARRAFVTPDRTVVVPLIKVVPVNNDLARARIIVDHLPTRTIRAAAGYARVA